MINLRAIVFVIACVLIGQPVSEAQIENDIAEHQRFIAMFSGAEDTAGTQKLGPRSTRAERRNALSVLSEEMVARGLDVQFHKYAHPNIHPTLDLILPPMRGVNVFAEIKATVETEQYVIVGGHYDTVRNSPGADDNASGVSALLSIATRISNLEQRYTNYIIVFFDQEEDDLGPGSKTFAEYVLDEGYDVHSMHNVDMIGYDGNGNRTLEVEVPNVELESMYQRAADAREIHSAPIHRFS